MCLFSASNVASWAGRIWLYRLPGVSRTVPLSTTRQTTRPQHADDDTLLSKVYEHLEYRRRLKLMVTLLHLDVTRTNTEHDLLRYVFCLWEQASEVFYLYIQCSVMFLSTLFFIGINGSKNIYHPWNPCTKDSL